VALANPKPLLDFTDFCTRFDSSAALAAYLQPDMGPYLVRLHIQLLLDGVYFSLAHEVAHYRLGHVEQRAAAVSEKREDEVAADAAALAALHSVVGFDPRSLIIIFNFASANEREVPPDRMDHPLGHNRLRILVGTLRTQPGGDRLRADVNAGLALLPSRPESFPSLLAGRLARRRMSTFISPPTPIWITSRI
jgi:hypothetical protein